MARIRSIHPGLFTDEGFMGLSAMARVFMIGLWVEADDQGVFEWKPLTLKARLLPADMVDISELLAELVGANFIQPFDYAGKNYGAVRNFRKFQRPKKANAIHPLPNELRTFVGLSADSSEAVPHQDGTDGENPPQMEDGGGRMEEVTTSDEVVVALASEPPPPDDDIGNLPEGLDRRKGSRLPEGWSLPEAWADWARERRPTVDCALEAEKFANYWHAKTGKDATKRDWFKTWQNWILNAKDGGNERSDDGYTRAFARAAGAL